MASRFKRLIAGTNHSPSRFGMWAITIWRSENPGLRVLITLNSDSQCFTHDKETLRMSWYKEPITQLIKHLKEEARWLSWTNNFSQMIYKPVRTLNQEVCDLRDVPRGPKGFIVKLAIFIANELLTWCKILNELLYS